MTNDVLLVLVLYDCPRSFSPRMVQILGISAINVSLLLICSSLLRCSEMITPSDTKLKRHSLSLSALPAGHWPIYVQIHKSDDPTALEREKRRANHIQT
jgi:hypothetical protein